MMSKSLTYGAIKMPNEFSKNEIVAFEKMGAEFEDDMAMSMLVDKLDLDPVQMSRTGDKMWFPQPYIVSSFDGTDATDNFGDITQLSTPVTIGYHKHVPYKTNPSEQRDPSRFAAWLRSGRQRLASDVNQSLLNVAAKQGTIFIKRAAAASGFSDLSTISARLDDLGIPAPDRNCMLSSGNYNSMAENLAGRETINDIPTKALRDAVVGRLAGIDTYKSGSVYRLAAAGGGGGITMSTLNNANNYHIPQATSVGDDGEESNYDNRYQTIQVSSTTSVAAGDAFTVGNVNEVHHITKQDTGNLKTFRVIRVVDSTHLVISPPIISNQVDKTASKQYQNCVVNTKSATAAITFLNTVTGAANPFWYKDAISIIPATYEIDGNVIDKREFRTEQGLHVVMTRAVDIKTHAIFTRLDMPYGVAMRNPEMAGVVMFSQT